MSKGAGLRVLDKASFSVSGDAIHLKAENVRGGVLEIEANDLEDISQTSAFTRKLSRTRLGFQAAKELVLDLDRDRIWDDL